MEQLRLALPPGSHSRANQDFFCPFEMKEGRVASGGQAGKEEGGRRVKSTPWDAARVRVGKG